MARRARVGRLRWRITFVLIAIAGTVIWFALRGPGSNIQDLLNAHTAAWEAGDGLAATALYVPAGRFVYGDLTYTGAAIGEFVSGVHDYEFEPLDDPVVVTNQWGEYAVSVVAWKSRVTMEHPQGNRMSAAGLCLFHLIEREGTTLIRRFEFLTNP
jgi:hypothetical protein